MRVPFLVILHRIIREMCWPINFDGKLYLGAIKIENITIDAVLPPKFEASKLLAF